MDARIAPPFMEATDASRLVCVVVVSYQEYSLTKMAARARDRQAAVALQNEAEESGATEEEATGGRTSRVGRPRGGMRVAARIGDRLRREIRRGRRPRVGDG